MFVLLAIPAFSEEQRTQEQTPDLGAQETHAAESEDHDTEAPEDAASGSNGSEAVKEHDNEGGDEHSADALAAGPIIIEDILRPPQGLESLALNLMRLQDAAASGQVDALTMQRRVLAEMSRLLRKASPHDLPSQRTLRAAIVYLLGGGRARDAATLLAATPETEPLRWILKGATHYAANQKEEALEAFEPFDPERLPASIGGRVALARAMVVPEDRLVERIRLLRMAGRLMPGTLVEESALRRLFAVAAVQSEPAPMQFIAEQYVERYSHSLFAAAVLDNYADAVVSFEERKSPVERGAVELLHNRLPTQARRASYIRIAWQSVVRGLSELALFSATRARRLSVEGSDDWHLATLLDAAILITTPDYDIASDLLLQIDPARLDGPSQELLAATKRLASTLRTPATSMADGPGAELELSPDQTQLRSKAEKLMSAADELLTSMTQ